MSCQQVSRIITTNATTLSTGTSISTPEDPYVFTETVPTTPPILFNTQKSRSRHSVVENNTQFIKTRTPSQKLPLAQLNRNVLKVNVPVSAEAITAGTGVNLKKALSPLPKSQQQPQQLQKNRITTNVCIVRPQLQQKQQKQQQQQQQLPVFTHTPSLWQTPLLLDTTPAVVTGNGNGNVNGNSSSPQISSAASLSSPRPVQTVIALPTLTTSTSPAAVAVATTSINNIGTNNTTTTTSILSTTVPQTAMVSPLLNTSNSTLPPSKFHHTTLAHHLEKVQCIKKPKKATAHKQPQQQQQQQLNTDAKLLSVSESVPPPLQALCEPKPITTTINNTATATTATTQHSDSSDLNEIPVNVIFRKPQSTGELTRTLLNANDGVPNADNDVTKNSNSFNTTNTTSTPAGNKMRNVKIIVPTQKCLVASTVSRLPTQLPATTADSKLAGEKDVVFVQPLAQQHAPMQLSSRPTTETSSKLMSSTNNANNVTMPALVLATTSQLIDETEKSLQTDRQQTSPPPLLKVSNSKRKFSKCTSPANTSQLQKKNRRIFASILNNERVSMHFGRGTNNTAVAVVKLSAAEVDADTSLLASATVLPYCVQKHWLHASDKQKKVSSTRYLALVPNTHREDHIAQHKNLLRRQALQMLTTRSLQKLPLYAARRRLMSVDRLLRKYHQQHGDYDRLHKTCIANACKNRAMELASHCHQHIISNATQQVFLPCTAKFADNKQCCVPVFDISHDMPLCREHIRKRDAYNRNLVEQRKLLATENIQQVQEHQQPQEKQQQQQNCYSGKKALSTTTAPARKRKLANATIGNPVGRPQKRAKKLSPTAVPNVINEAQILPPLSAVLQRKSSTTSLESIASNSYSSNSQPLTQQSDQQQQQQPMLNHMVLSPPALAPLSGLSVGGGVGSGIGVASNLLNFGNSAAVAADLKEHEINDIVTQLMVAAHNNNSNSNGSQSSSSINNTNNNNNNCNSINFANTNSNSNFTSSGLGSSSSLPSATDELLTQDMLSICENSSVYASSEDTGLGGLSETELMAGAPDADEIPLVDARFIFDDLANAISSMPADAYNELFTTVRQDEREDLERALEIADKHLKTLQQTIGSGSDFLDDFLDVNDDILPDTDICSKMDIVSSVMHSPETSNMESSSLFIDSISNGANGTAGPTTSCPTTVDIRGLVQT